MLSGFLSKWLLQHFANPDQNDLTAQGLTDSIVKRSHTAKRRFSFEKRKAPFCFEATTKGPPNKYYRPIGREKIFIHTSYHDFSHWGGITHTSKTRNTVTHHSRPFPKNYQRTLTYHTEPFLRDNPNFPHQGFGKRSLPKNCRWQNFFYVLLRTQNAKPSFATDRNEQNGVHNKGPDSPNNP